MIPPSGRLALLPLAAAAATVGRGGGRRGRVIKEYRQWSSKANEFKYIKGKDDHDGQILHPRIIPPERIRNFGIIAHIDHGKSTLADRLLELTGCINPSTSNSNTEGPTLDTLPVERERGITVKAQTASMFFRPAGQSSLSSSYLLNLIDTPGHADFTNEVARSLTAMQGALLVVDAVTGVQAQTVAHYWRAREHGVNAILPVINKIDLPQANIDAVLDQLEKQLDINIWDLPILAISAKSGMNVASILPAIVERIPPPEANIEANLEARLIDCWFREFRGVICLVSIQNGKLQTGDSFQSAASDKVHVVEEIGILQPNMVRTDYLHAGQIGYVRCGMKSTQDAIIGDTFLTPSSSIMPKPITIKLPPPRRMRPIVFAGMFPAVREEYEQVMSAVEKLLLNDSSVSVEKIVSSALGPGWRLGFLGSLHMDVFGQRLEQEFGVDVILTAPNVSYKVIYKDGTMDNPIGYISSVEEYPSEKTISNVREFREPFIKATIIFPALSIGAVSQLCSDSRCGLTTLEYLSVDRVKMTVELPLVEVISDFNDRLLSISAGYASFDYEPIESRPVELLKINIRLNGDPVELLGTVQPSPRAVAIGRSWVRRLANILPRQQFAIAIQAVIGTKVIARENISAVRKDVIAKCYGGDKTRKMKLLQAQKEGKERMRMFGKVEIPHDAFVDIMRMRTTLDQQ